MVKGTQVRCLVDIMSNHSSRVIKAGTIGFVLGLSSEFISENEQFIEWMPDSVLVYFGVYKYDCSPDELEVI